MISKMKKTWREKQFSDVLKSLIFDSGNEDLERKIRRLQWKFFIWHMEMGEILWEKTEIVKM